MLNNLWILVVFWGFWIIVPIIFDGLLTLIYMHTVIFNQYYKKLRPTKGPKMAELNPENFPTVSIIIPAYNEEDNIDECLDFLKIQTYPHKKLEIIVVDNGSTDRTSEIVKEHMKNNWQLNHTDKVRQLLHGKTQFKGQVYETAGFEGTLKLIIRQEKGKAQALNAGIKLSIGEIVINIDCRSFLAPDAIFEMVKKFIENPEYGAATGNIEIEWAIIYKRNKNGDFILDNEGCLVPRALSRKERFLAKSQFLEYLTSFYLGRWFQDITSSMYTFSGAFSAFKREVLM